MKIKEMKKRQTGDWKTPLINPSYRMWNEKMKIKRWCDTKEMRYFLLCKRLEITKKARCSSCWKSPPRKRWTKIMKCTWETLQELIAKGKLLVEWRPAKRLCNHEQIKAKKTMHKVVVGKRHEGNDEPKLWSVAKNVAENDSQRLGTNWMKASEKTL